MKKRLVILCIVSACLLLFSIFATAHAGKTDSNGGHRDHLSGEYHYHHGYPAHSHYDMDGDGIKDCAYDFDDKTNHNNNSSNNTNGSNDKTNNNSINSESTAKESKNEITFGKVVAVIFLLIPLSLITLYILSMVMGLISIIIEWIAKKFFNVNIEKSIQQRILHILLIIGLVIIVPLEILFLLEIL